MGQRKDRPMDNKILQEIVDFVRKRLLAAYGVCGVASGPDMAQIDTTDNVGNDIRIIITAKGSDQ